MRDIHHPTIKRLDTRWMLDCPECRRALASSFDGFGELPIGIGIPLESELTAQRLKTNHERASNRHDRLTAPPELPQPRQSVKVIRTRPHSPPAVA